MVDPDRYYIVVRWDATLATRIPERQVRSRICQGTTTVKKLDDYRPGQLTTVEDDGRFQWIVTRSPEIAPDGEKRIAYVVSGRLCQAAASSSPVATHPHPSRSGSTTR
jgi:hypothetical protein